MATQKTVEPSLLDRLTPECGVMGILMLFGCAATTYFTYHFEWDAYAYTVAFSVIMTGGKGMKILDKKFGSKGK